MSLEYLDTTGSDLGFGAAARSVVSKSAEVENMFHDIAEPSPRVGSRKALVLPLSIVTHVLLVAVLLLVPLIAPGVLPIPAAAALMAFVSRDVELPRPPAPRRPSDANMPSAEVHPRVVPLEAPGAITPESAVDPAPPPDGTVEGAWSLPEGIPEGLVPPPPPPPPPSAPDTPVRVGGNIRPPTKIKDVRPLYPTIAQVARVEGMVIIETTIGATGRVLDARVIRSIPVLDDAALEAVRQWEFTPTLLNGSPVSVVLTVTVNFKLR
jgi:periplasmic protein TonB